ncbi:uncharacterized [Tachysurus ichikawai]
MCCGCSAQANSERLWSSSRAVIKPRTHAGHTRLPDVQTLLEGFNEHKRKIKEKLHVHKQCGREPDCTHIEAFSFISPPSAVSVSALGLTAAREENETSARANGMQRRIPEVRFC